MPKVSREHIANVDDYGIVEDRHEDVDGTTISFITIRQDVDAAPLLKGLPNDSCTCPHWGYVFKGRLVFRVNGVEEVYEPGDAFYLPPGHIQTAEAGTEYIQFSPSEELAVVEATMMRNMQAMQTA
jgi:hypothetical protein